MDIKDYIAFGASFFFVVVGVGFFGWLKILKETNVLLKEQNEELKIANKELLDKHNLNVTNLASMQGQIDVLKSIPLVNIDITLKNIETFNKSLADSNELILKTLQKSAKDLKRSAA